MRTLTPTLLAAQRSASAVPYVSAVLDDSWGERTRIRFERLYTGVEGEYFSAVCGAGDGSLVRARIDPATKVLYTQRVASPGPASSFSSWASHGTVSSQASVALAWRDSPANVVLLYVAADGVTVTYKLSSDYGASWTGAFTQEVAAAAVTYVALAYSNGSVPLALWTVGATVRASRDGAASTAWSNSVTTITGLAVAHGFDWGVVVCGTATGPGDAKAWGCIYGDGAEQTLDTWSALAEITTAAAGSGVSFHAPALVYGLGPWRLFFVEKYTGTASYSRLQFSTMDVQAGLKQDLWREPAPFAYGGDYGVSAAARNLAGYLWLTSPAGIWRGLNGSLGSLDVSADLVEASVRIEDGDGRVRLVLRDDPFGADVAGRYSSFGTGSLGVLQRGVRLQLAPGYRTPAGAEVSSGPSYWVESIEQVTGPEPQLVINARDAWWVLDQWRARRSFAWAAGARSVFQLIQFVAARAGLETASNVVSAALTTLKPAFIIQPGETAKTAVRRLLAMVPDVLLFQPYGGVLMIHYPQAADASTYSFVAAGAQASGGHALVKGRYRLLGQALNRVRVLGAGVYNEALDLPDIEAVGERAGQVLDLNLTTGTLAGDRAAYDLRDAEMAERRDEVSLFGVCCGCELWDVVDITDPQAGLSTAKRRVRSLSWRYEPGRYDMQLELGSV